MKLLSKKTQHGLKTTRFEQKAPFAQLLEGFGAHKKTLLHGWLETVSYRDLALIPHGYR